MASQKHYLVKTNVIINFNNNENSLKEKNTIFLDYTHTIVNNTFRKVKIRDLQMFYKKSFKVNIED